MQNACPKNALRDIFKALKINDNDPAFTKLYDRLDELMAGGLKKEDKKCLHNRPFWYVGDREGITTFNEAKARLVDMYHEGVIGDNHVIVRVPHGQRDNGAVVYRFLITDLEFSTHREAIDELSKFQKKGEDISKLAIYEATLKDVMEMSVKTNPVITFVPAVECLN